jgi:hypothetical protein
MIKIVNLLTENGFHLNNNSLHKVLPMLFMKLNRFIDRVNQFIPQIDDLFELIDYIILNVAKAANVTFSLLFPHIKELKYDSINI